ncbi:hypothetical protein A3J23_02200 [Candidatus Peregrinibacteria bacterium RIFCSPLOWO2_02_FULL_48_14]|nr:MAG: hypothetical protein A2974_00950 [Candidatus Peregrinibacteria bacterium RIFCSPLOWO2_01_FULL_48_20]OGJ43510.1 MAG: hypothetical protein A3J23_02200 [Candidatus Peregrinibacteria bacterium RIFCSPLOWO2_02_FULL_48_14]
MSASQPFVLLHPTSIKGFLIFLDIDGTLCTDGTTDVDEATLKQISRLKETNTLYLCSNKKNHPRNQAISDLIGIPYLKTKLRKPDPKILNLIKAPIKTPLLVIGDLFWTDGRFARKIGAKFIQVKSKTGTKDPWWISWAHRADDLLSLLLLRP